MVIKKKVLKKKLIIKEIPRKKILKKKVKKILSKDIPTLKLKNEHDIAMDFATKVYKKLGRGIKSIILFGSTSKKVRVAGSDIDIIIVIDDASIKWDQELIAWYRQELETIMGMNPYSGNIHINTVKLTTWWEDLVRGDPIVLNILRHGDLYVLDEVLLFCWDRGVSSTGFIQAYREKRISLLELFFPFFYHFTWCAKNLGIKFILKNLDHFLWLNCWVPIMVPQELAQMLKDKISRSKND